MSDAPRLSLIVARARNGVIGREGDLPWRLGSDLKWFKRTTLGKPVVMGRKTWDSLPKKPLPKRANFIATRDLTLTAPDARVFADLTALIAAAQAQAAASGEDEVCVIGGEALYRALLPAADRIYLTEVDAAPEGDAIFPAFDGSDWSSRTVERGAPGPTDDHAFEIRVLDRIRR